MDQLCIGTKAGIKAAVRAISEIFNADDTEGLLLVDARNAFNALNHAATLWNCCLLWPRCAMFLFNSYRGYATIIVRSSEQGPVKGRRQLMAIYSKEGTTQGCPLAMLQYAVGVHPLIMRLKDPLKHIQNWYADDSACTGLLLRIRDWLMQLMEIGPSYGYYVESSKNIIAVKDAIMTLQ